MIRLLLIFSLVFVMFSYSCNDDLPEIQENIHSAKDNAVAETHLFSTFDAAYDVIATNGKFRKQETSIIPSSVLLEFLDSSFKDGSGVSVTVDFGPLGTQEPMGTLCQDGKYRAGKMHIYVNQSIQSIDFRATVTLDSTGFYTGNGTDMVKLSGTTIITPADVNAMRVQMKNIKITTDKHQTTWNSDRIVRQVKDSGEEGIWGDEYEVTGTANGRNRDGEEFDVVIDEPLVKRMETDCAQTFVDGSLTVRSKVSSQVITLDYDPKSDQACDRLVEANLNGRKQIFEIR